MKCCLLILYLCVNAYAWTALEYTESSPGHPGSCASKDQKVGVLEKGEVKQLEGCVEVRCGDGRISYYGCGSVAAGPSCQIVKGDQSKPYPDCCPNVKCQSQLRDE